MDPLFRVADRALPPDLDAPARLQGRLGVLLSAMVGVIIIVFSPAFAFYASLPAIAAACVVCGVGYLLLAVGWGRLGHGVSLHLLLVLCYVLESVAVFRTGGSESPFLAFLMFPVLYAALLGSSRTLAVWTGAAVAYVFGLALVPASVDLGAPPDLAVFWQISVTPMALIGALVVLVVMRLQQAAWQEAQEAHRQAEAAHEAEARARAQAEQASRAKSDFLAVASHEMRTPLAGMLGALELMQEEADDATAVHRWSQVIARSGRRLSALVDDLLDFKRIERDELRLERERVEPLLVLHEVAELLSPEGRVRVEGGEGLLQVGIGDASRLRQVVINLVGNALKFSEDTVIVRASGDVVLEVIDRGPGVDPTLRDQLFDAFVRGDTGPDRNASGTGLGLAISRRLVEAMGGTIELVPTEIGAHFRVRLPLEPYERPEPTAVAEGSLDVLVVDDDPLTRMIAARMVVVVGHRAVEVSGGEAALVHCAERQPDVVLLDWHMPGMDGFVTAERLRERFPDLRVIGYTASTAPDEIRRAEEVGMNRVLRKPISPDELRELLGEATPAGARATHVGGV
ncbi:MAG: response regulator [Deltaproteobacteria bacterium]|nr:MAG: response regulator [Deltaproteobacteria bacterium]